MSMRHAFLVRYFRLFADLSGVAFIRLSHVILLFTVAFEFKQELRKMGRRPDFSGSPFFFFWFGRSRVMDVGSCL